MAFHLISGLAAAALMTAPAPPSAVVSASTYLRAAPAASARVIDEVEHDSRVVVLGRTDAWVHVRQGAVEGFVDAAAVNLPAARAGGGGGCVRVKLADDLRGHATRLCGP